MDVELAISDASMQWLILISAMDFSLGVCEKLAKYDGNWSFWNESEWIKFEKNNCNDQHFRLDTADYFAMG